MTVVTPYVYGGCTISMVKTNYKVGIVEVLNYYLTIRMLWIGVERWQDLPASTYSKYRRACTYSNPHNIRNLIITVILHYITLHFIIIRPRNSI